MDSSLLRSIKWRLRLRLLLRPDQNHHSGQPLTLCQILESNLDLLNEQKSCYEGWRNTYASHLAASETEDQGDLQVNQDGDDEGKKPAAEVEAVKEPAEVDPLTMMVMEQQAKKDRLQDLELKYRKERARRKRGLLNEGSLVSVSSEASSSGDTAPMDSAILGIIEKDLNRLPSPTGNWANEEHRREWIQSLREMLYIYHQEHRHIGYRQGMHEVASYLLFSLELDNLQLQQNASTSVPTRCDIEHVFGVGSAYFILEKILTDIRQAFDVKVASNSQPLEEMSNSVLNKLKFDTHLFSLLHHLPVPPQLYCTKWIRLLYSRETVGWENVLALWDVFTELFAEGWEWMAILETTAADRLLLSRQTLLHPENQSRTVELVMNMPQMSDIRPLVEKLRWHLNQQKDGVVPVPEDNVPSLRVSRTNVTGMMQTDDQATPFTLQSLRKALDQGKEQIATKGQSLRQRINSEWETFKHNQQSRESDGAMTPVYADPLFAHAVNDATMILPPVAEPMARTHSLPAHHSHPAFPVGTGSGEFNAGASIEKFPSGPQRHQDMANQLGSSVATLQSFVMVLAKDTRSTPVPKAVWEALADIEVVRRALTLEP